jgi:hypothetical protein
MSYTKHNSNDQKRHRAGLYLTSSFNFHFSIAKCTLGRRKLEISNATVICKLASPPGTDLIGRGELPSQRPSTLKK